MSPLALAADPSLPWHVAETRREARALLDAQLWCLGQDILHPSGNRLAAYGAERHRDGLHARQPSCYRHAGARRVVCWGYGLWLGDPLAGDGCFVRRKGFSPVLTSDAWPWAGAFVRDDRPGRRPATAAERERAVSLVGALATWCADYEAWIAATLPAEWRGVCEARRPRGVRRSGRVSAEGLAAGWQALAARCGGGAPAAC